jgi:hypothetical protein
MTNPELVHQPARMHHFWERCTGGALSDAHLSSANGCGSSTGNQWASACLAALMAAELSPWPPLKYRFNSTALIEASRMPDSIRG